MRLALAWGSPAEIQALLEGLVKERIISKPYSKNLNLHRLTKGFAPFPSETAHKSASDPMNYPGPTSQQDINQYQLSQLCQDGAISCHNQTRLEYASPMGEYSCTRTRLKIYPSVMAEHNLNPRLFSTQIVHDCRCSLGLNDEMTELLRSSAEKAESECKSRNKGNLENEKEWLEQVEEAARRIAVPLWQHWDRGRRMLLPLVPTMTTGCSTSESTATGSEAQCPVLIMEEETELAIACRTLDLYIDNFNCTEAEITDQGFTLDTSHCQVTDTPKGLDFSVATTALDVHHFSFSGAAWNTSQIPHLEACAADANNITDMLESDPNICMAAHRTTNGTEDLLCATLGVPDNVKNVGSADGLTDEQKVDLHWGKFALNHHIVSLRLFFYILGLNSQVPSVVLSKLGFHGCAGIIIALRETSFSVHDLPSVFPFVLFTKKTKLMSHSPALYLHDKSRQALFCPILLVVRVCLTFSFIMS